MTWLNNCSFGIKQQLLTHSKTQILFKTEYSCHICFQMFKLNGFRIFFLETFSPQDGHHLGIIYINLIEELTLHILLYNHSLVSDKMNFIIFLHSILYCSNKFEDTKGVIRSHKSQDRQHNGLELEDTKGVIRSHKSKDRQHNGQVGQTTIYKTYT